MEIHQFKSLLFPTSYSHHFYFCFSFPMSNLFAYQTVVLLLGCLLIKLETKAAEINKLPDYVVYFFKTINEIDIFCRSKNNFYYVIVALKENIKCENSLNLTF